MFWSKISSVLNHITCKCHRMQTKISSKITSLYRTSPNPIRLILVLPYVCVMCSIRIFPAVAIRSFLKVFCVYCALSENSDDTTRWILLFQLFVKPLHTSLEVSSRSWSSYITSSIQCAKSSYNQSVIYNQSVRPNSEAIFCIIF